MCYKIIYLKKRIIQCAKYVANKYAGIYFTLKYVVSIFIRSYKIFALTASRAALWIEEKSILGTIKGYQFCLMLYKYSTMQHLHFYSSLHTSPLMLLPFARLLRMTFASMQLFVDEEELCQPSYDFSPSVMELTAGRFSSISPKLNLCSNSTANRGTTC